MRLDELTGPDQAQRKENDGRGDPTMDLPDFDDMPIHMEDINQSQKKLDEIIDAPPADDVEIMAQSYEVAGSNPNTREEEKPQKVSPEKTEVDKEIDREVVRPLNGPQQPVVEKQQSAEK